MSLSLFNLQILYGYISQLSVTLLLPRLLLLTPLLLIACSDEQQRYMPAYSATAPLQGEKSYIFSVHPLHNPQRLFVVFDPLMQYLSKHIESAKFQLEASRSYEAYNQKLYALTPHFSLPNPYQTVNAIDRGYNVFAKMGDDENFRGIILVRKDSNIRNVSDLRGKTVSYPAKSALAATMLPQYYLQTHGVNVLQELDNRYVGSQESSIMSVMLGESAAGATWPPPWRALQKQRPELQKQLQVIWQTNSLPNNGVVAHPSVANHIVTQVEDLLTHLHENEQGREILAGMELSRFETATEATYLPVRDFLITFSNEVRPLQ